MGAPGEFRGEIPKLHDEDASARPRRGLRPMGRIVGRALRGPPAVGWRGTVADAPKRLWRRCAPLPYNTEATRSSQQLPMAGWCPTGQNLAAVVLLLRKAAGGNGCSSPCRRRVFQVRGAVRGADSLLRAACPVKNSQPFVQQVRERTADRPPSRCRLRHRWSTCRTLASSST